MKLKGHYAVLSLIAAGAFVLPACGTDSNTTASGGPSETKSPAVDCGGKSALKASGSSAQANAMTRFVAAYEAACPDQTLNYTSNGSGAGVKEFIGKQTDFAGSDSPLSAEKGEVDKAKARCDGNPAWNLPTVFGPIAVTYNLSGVSGVALDGPTAAKIFSGQIKTWNDPAITKLNTGKSLPAQPIVVVFRSDESGTTDNFQKYLTAASDGVWTKGTGKSFAGGVGEGAKGNEGTSAAVKGTPGAITYNEWSYAQKQNLTMAQIVNSGGGDPVVLNAESAATAVNGAKIKGSGNDLVLDLNSIYATKTPGAYPIMLGTYEIVCSKYTDTATATAIKGFLTTAVTGGQQGLADNGYVPLPTEFQQKLKTAINAIS